MDMVFERYAFNRVHRTRTGERGSPLQNIGEYKNTKNKTVGCNRLQFANWLPDNNFPFFTFNFQLARGQSHCRDCPLAFGDILILKLLIFLKCDFNFTVTR